MEFRQLFEKESSTYTYFIWDQEGKEAMVIDPVQETYQRDCELIEEWGLKLKYICETHIHADHVTSSLKLKNKFGGYVMLSQHSGAQHADQLLKEGDELNVGKYGVRVLETPGHTATCVSYHVRDRVFTGDALLIRVDTKHHYLTDEKLSYLLPDDLECLFLHH